MSEKPLSLEAKALIEEIRIIQKDIDYRKLIIRGGNSGTYDISIYKTFRELYRDLYYKEMAINDAEMTQNEFISIIDALNDYIPKSQKYNEAKNSLLNNARSFYEGREKIIEGFKKGIFTKSDGDDDDDDDDDDDEQQQASKKIIKIM